MEHFDIAILGAGPGGYVAALKAAQMGASVAIVEQSHLGGTCLNNGCIPSKALLASAELMYHIAHAGALGVKVAGEAAADWPAIQKHKDKVLANLRAGIKNLLNGRKVKLYSGRGKLDGAGKIAVTNAKGETETFTASKTILAVGSVPGRIPGWPDNPEVICTSDDALHWKALPKSLMIVGGGVIGCEFACMMREFGVEITVIEMMPRLLPEMDEQIGDTMAEIFRKRRIAIHLNTKVESLKTDEKGCHAQLSTGQAVTSERMLVAVGRRPNTNELGLESVGLATERGFVRVNEFMETSVKDIYCIGDANGRCLLAHAASAHGVAAVKNALGHREAFTAPIPGAVYTFPEIGAVGMTQQEARAKSIPVSIGYFPIGYLGKAMAVAATEGFAKVIRHRETDELLGVHILGHNATECIGAAGALLHKKASTHDLADLIIAHPSISESLKEAAEDALGMGLHLPPRKTLRIAADL
ncbi:MAG: dihydrolipoyl dehydrogenase [Candidatus Sumerlaeota bacterium]|nr:dihydrolipoyl dehydrogenase [Candidatus Sumerlaeota bacterium]